MNLRLVLAVFLLCLSHGVSAQERDPTAAPAEAGAQSSTPEGSESTAGALGSSVVVRNGRPHLVVGTRLVAVGQKVGNARLERITETEIWWREDGHLNKVPRYAGIQRSVAKPVATCKRAAVRRKPSTPPPAPVSSTQAATPAAPCDGAQP